MGHTSTHVGRGRIGRNGAAVGRIIMAHSPSDGAAINYEIVWVTVHAAPEGRGRFLGPDRLIPCTDGCRPYGSGGARVSSSGTTSIDGTYNAARRGSRTALLHERRRPDMPGTVVHLGLG